MRPPPRLLLGAALLLAVAGCSLFYRNPQVRIADVRVVGVGLTSGTAEVILEVENPNSFALETRGFRYLLEVSDQSRPERWDTVAVGYVSDTVRIGRRSTEEVPILIPFRYQALGTAFRAWFGDGAIPYRLEGEVQARGAGVERNLPFRSRGTVTP